MILRITICIAILLQPLLITIHSQHPFDFLFFPEPENENTVVMSGLGLLGSQFWLYGGGINTNNNEFRLNLKFVDIYGNISIEYAVDLSETGNRIGAHSYAVSSSDTSVFLMNAASVDSSTGFAAMRVEKIDMNGNLQWYKRFNDEKTHNFQQVSRGAIPSEPGDGVIVFGFDHTIDSSLIRAEVNGQGELIRYDTIIVPLEGGGQIGRELTAASDGEGGQYVAYGKGNQGSSFEQCYIAHIDSAGQIINANTLSPRSMRRMRRHPNGDLVYTTFNWNPDPGNSSYEPTLMGIDGESLDTNWVKVNKGVIINYQDSIFGAFHQGYATEMIITRSGKIITQLLINDRLTGLQCFDINGNLLWQRFIHTNNDLFPGSTVEHYRYDHLLETNDGNLLMGGYLRWHHPELTNGSFQNLILLQLDSLGCVEPGCQNDTLYDLTIYTDVLEPAANSADVLKILVYPNPTKEWIYFISEKPGGAVPTTIEYRLYNLAGQLFSIGELALNEGLSVTDLPPGFYYLWLRSEKGENKTVGFLKQ